MRAFGRKNYHFKGRTPFMDFLQITEEVLSTQDPTLFWRLLIPILVKEMILHYLSDWVGKWIIFENRFLGRFCKDYVWWRKVATLENSLPVWVEECCMKSRNDSETYLLCILLKVVFNQFAPKRTNKTTFYPFFSVKKHCSTGSNFDRTFVWSSPLL